MADKQLYAWQGEALSAWRDQSRRGIIEAVTGTGKTMVGLVAAREALSDGGCVLVLVPTVELQSQWREVLRKELSREYRIGRLGGDFDDSLADHHIVVSIVNTARERDLRARRPVLVIADECHRYAADQNVKALRSGYTHRLGLTATLERTDRLERRLLDYFGPVCFRIGYARALADDVVSHYSVALVGVPMSGPETAQYGQLSDAIGELFGQLVGRWAVPKAPYHHFISTVKDMAEDQWHAGSPTARQFLKLLQERKTLLATSPSKLEVVRNLAPALRVADRSLIFTERVETSEIVSAQLRTTGLRAESLGSNDTSARRAEVFHRFKTGKLDVISAPRVLDEGVDVPEADLAIIQAASRTKRQMIQRMGRVLRRKPDNRLARFAVLYLQGTTEDPKRGAHETFLSEVTQCADDIEIFTVDQLGSAIEFLATTEPLEPPRPPRMVGDPKRHVRTDVRSDEDFDADIVIGAGA